MKNLVNFQQQFFNDTQCNVVCHGSGYTEGLPAAAYKQQWFPNLLRDKLLTARGSSQLSGKYSNSVLDAGLASDFSIVERTGLNEGISGIGLHVAEMDIGHQAHLTFIGTGLDIVYTEGPVAGTFKYRVDGGGYTTVDTSAVALKGGQTVEVRGLSESAHFLEIEGVTLKNYLEGVYSYRGDEVAGLRVFNGAKINLLPATLADSLYYYGYEHGSPQYCNPHLYTLEYGLTEYINQQNPEEFRAGIYKLTQQIINTFPKVSLAYIIPSNPKKSYATAYGWEIYRQIILDIADQYSAVVVDQEALLGSFEIPANNIYSDSTSFFPTLAGMNLVMDNLVEQITTIPSSKAPLVQKYVRGPGVDNTIDDVFERIQRQLTLFADVDGSYIPVTDIDISRGTIKNLGYSPSDKALIGKGAAERIAYDHYN